MGRAEVPQGVRRMRFEGLLDRPAAARSRSSHSRCALAAYRQASTETVRSKRTPNNFHASCASPARRAVYHAAVAAADQCAMALCISG